MAKKNILKENRHHSNALIPFSYYKSSIPELFPFVPMHSHSEWELNFITDGEGFFITDKQKIKAEESLKKANVSLESAKDRVKEAKNRLEAYAQMLG